MKKIILIGRVGAGKTTLTQKLRGEELSYYKTQYIHYGESIIDTPGEYTELRQLSGPLALYAYEANVVGLVISADDPYSIFSPNITCLVNNREVVGIITGIDKKYADVKKCTNFPVSSYTGEGIAEILEYLNKEDIPREKNDKNNRICQ